MKNFLSAVLLLFFAQSYAQTDKSVLVRDVNMYGYINGQRLDSLTTTYAYFSINFSSRIRFDYGQPKTTSRSFIVTNAGDEPLSFDGNNVAISVLNFLHYNHWELVSYDNPTGNYLIRK